MLIDKQTLCSLIPHSGTMCLLDGVISWDEHQIRCISHSHTKADNPLRHNGTLSVIHTLEYAGQAMAVHGGLLKQGSTPSYLAAARNLQFYVERLDTLDDALTIDAESLLSDGKNLIYAFIVTAGHQNIATGRITVM